MEPQEPQETPHPQYILDYPPFRFVHPYKHIFKTHAKQRWYGRPLLQTLTKQFKAYSNLYFQKAIANHQIRINNNPTSQDYKIKNGDLLTHQTIRQQPPILNIPISIIKQTENYLIVEKPPSFIVHTGGGYHYNTLVSILEYEMGYKNLFICHRLDRLTSGLIFLSKNKEKATKFHEQSTNQEMKKMYYARVGGNFPYDQYVLEAPIVCLSHKEGIFSVFDPNNEEHINANKKATAKQSNTKFVKIYYHHQTNTSLLECYPITGRTHQIRVHLQYMGYPILNDTCYGGQFVGNGIIHKFYPKLEPKKPNKNEENMKKQKEQEVNEKEKQQMNYRKWDYSERSWEIYLHSYKYKLQGEQYISQKPYWFDKNAIINQKCQQYYPKRHFQKIIN